MTTRGDATYDLVMLALGWVDERWSKIFDRVKAWAGEETEDRFTPSARERIRKLEGHCLSAEQAFIQIVERLKKLEVQAMGNEGLWRGHNEHHLGLDYLRAELEKRLAYLEDDGGTRASDIDIHVG